MLEFLWLAAGATLIAALLTLAFSVMWLGSFRAGLAQWNDIWWYMLSGGRWNDRGWGDDDAE